MTTSCSSIQHDSLEETLDLFKRHTGVWVGTYTHIDSAGNISEVHDSKLELALDGMRWWQRNIYTKDDGGLLTFEFEGEFSDQGILVLDTPRLVGKAWKSGECVLLNWQYKDAPQNNNHEIISLVTDGHRTRTWHCHELEVVKEFVLIEEFQVSPRVER